MSDEQLDQVWYAAGENRDGITPKGATLIFTQPVPNIPGGFLLFELSESGVRSMLPSLPEGGQLTITRNGTWLYPFQPDETLRQRAEQQNINIQGTKLSTFDAASVLKQLLR